MNKAQLMFKATGFEYRFRFAIHGLIFILGFFAPWTRWLDLTTTSSLIVLPTTLARYGWIPYSLGVADGFVVVMLVFTGLGAWLRVWGSAYVGAGVVQSHAMHGEAMLADGPYRRTRNPLYLGTLLHTFGIALLMPPSGAIFTVVLIWVLQIRLALAEEPFLTARFGQAYLDYVARVPRFLPTVAPQISPAGQTPRWGQAVLGELYFPAVTVAIAITGWSFDKTALRQGVLISLGVWLVVRAFLPSARASAARAA